MIYHSEHCPRLLCRAWSCISPYKYAIRRSTNAGAGGNRDGCADTSTHRCGDPGGHFNRYCHTGRNTNRGAHTGRDGHPDDHDYLAHP
jgi:hypothetical protein